MEKVLATIRGAVKSFTVWFNGLMSMVPIVIPMLMQELPAMRAYVPDDIYKWLFLTVIVGNFLLRIKTTKALSEK